MGASVVDISSPILALSTGPSREMPSVPLLNEIEGPWPILVATWESLTSGWSNLEGLLGVVALELSL